ncbi:SMP-30/gluconolactonase/LRE family protein [Nocardia brasiliensis]|uniref:SMP-30/gluconolactonase/LRE family protein n=1 Tax=Nocardia brasiliensis TaxID=37326 RepID=UPI00190FABF9|nr:hypothetical protein [Nocardia brasiliensis]
MTERQERQAIPTNPAFDSPAARTSADRSTLWGGPGFGPDRVEQVGTAGQQVLQSGAFGVGETGGDSTLDPNRTGVGIPHHRGAIYRATPGTATAEVFLPEGADGRKTANGLKVDQAGRLWVTDSTDGVTVYDTATRAPLARLDVAGTAPRFVNDLAVTPDGTAYLTDSSRGVIYRVTADQVSATAAHGGRAELTTHFDLNSAMAPHAPSDFTLNGTVADPAGRYLLAVDMHVGELFRIDLTPNAIGQIRKVALRGSELTSATGWTCTTTPCGRCRTRPRRSRAGRSPTTGPPPPWTRGSPTNPWPCQPHWCGWTTESWPSPHNSTRAARWVRARRSRSPCSR